MFPGKKRKAITFSFDDGVTQDRRLVELFNKYNLKCTFNINSLSLGMGGRVAYDGFEADHHKIEIAEVKTLFQGHEVAVHTSHHPDLTKISDDDIKVEVEEDRLFLEKLVGYKIFGMAYPFGTTDERVINVLATQTPIKYSRVVWSNYSFARQENLLNLRPSAHCLEWEKLYQLADEFFSLSPDEDIIFYIWGHSYEFDFENTWDKWEEFLKYIANKSDVYYGTNYEVLITYAKDNN